MVVPVSGTSVSSVADNAIEVQNLSASVIYHAIPPLHPTIAGTRATENGIAHNLMTAFVDMNNPEGFGVVAGLEEFMIWIASRD